MWEPITSGVSGSYVHLRGTGKVEAMEHFVCVHRVGAALFLIEPAVRSPNSHPTVRRFGTRDSPETVGTSSITK
jgi:hypothetical protein